MRAFLAFVARVERAGLWAAMACLAALFLLGLAQIVWRTATGGGLGFAVEYTGYLTGLSFSLGLGWALGQGGHIRVPLLIDRLPERWAHRLDLAASLIGAATAGIAALGLAAWSWTSAVDGARSYFASQTLLAVPQFPFAAGVAILALSLTGRAVALAAGHDRTGAP